jgi:hypothetical protein
MKEQELLSEVLLGCRAAIEFCNSLSRVSQVLDDLIDRDRPVEKESIIQSHWEMLVEIPNNNFYRQHELSLRPLISTVFLDWLSSVQLEKSNNENELRAAWILRDQLCIVINHCALLLGGFDHARKSAIMVRQFVHDEDFDSYVKSIQSGVGG